MMLNKSEYEVEGLGPLADGNADQTASAGKPPSIITLSEFLAQFDPPDYQVVGLIQRGFIYSVTGKTGSGKTGVGTLLAVLMGNPTGGQKFGPYEVVPGHVLYIPAENKTDVQMRFIGLAHRMSLDPAKLNILITGDATRLAKDFEQEMARIRRDLDAFGKLGMVIVDTVAALFPGDNENDNVQALHYAKRLRAGIAGLPGRPCGLVLAHPIKNPASPADLLPRGGGSFVNEMDGNFTLWAHDDRLVDLHWTGKLRGPDFEKITLRHETVYCPTLVDSAGRPLPTAVTRSINEAETEAAEKNAVSQEDALLAAMHDRPDGTLDQWARDCRWFVNGDPFRPNKFAAHRVIKRLEKDKLVAKEGRGFIFTKSGKSAVKKALADR